MLYRGYVETKDKECIEKFKGRSDLKTLEDVQDLPEYAGVLAKDVILIDIDDQKQSEILMQIVDDMQLDCRVIQTSRGRHFLFRNTAVKQCYTKVSLAIGLKADIKVGTKNSYEVLKYNHEERFIEWDIEEGGEYQELPKWLQPLKRVPDFIDMGEGDGRNQELFNYILNLQTNDFNVDESRETIRIINKYILKSPLPDEEIETVLRDDAFQKPVFYKGSTFLFDKFAAYMVNVCHVVKINGQLHVYRDGLYWQGYKDIAKTMIGYIPNLKKTARREVIDYMELIAHHVQQADAKYIAFRNGVLNLVTGELIEPSPDIVLTNRIDWNYNPSAYDELGDKTLNRLSCSDAEIRALLEECIGYCMYRRNELGKAFILTGDKSNGKSTFLDVVKAILGEENISALDLKELGDRFSTSMMFGKLANIGDDIGDDFLQGNQVAMFKKVVTGNRIKAERKGQDPFEFNPYVKLLFSANDIPRMKDKTGAVLRRLIIIPFNARFSKYLPDGSPDPEYRPFIKYDLIKEQCIEYLIRLGIEGLKRILENDEFTKSVKVQGQVDSYEEENNPILAFLNEYELDDILHEPTEDIYRVYTVFCAENNMNPMGKIVFCKQLCKRLHLKSVPKKIGGKNKRVFERDVE